MSTDRSAAHRFRKKPVVIEAVETKDMVAEFFRRATLWPLWLCEAYDRGDLEVGEDSISIKTPEGEMRAEFADWIIRGIKGEIYPCKPDIFAATYDPVTE